VATDESNGCLFCDHFDLKRAAEDERKTLPRFGLNFDGQPSTDIE
jgi:hypothetical protein